MTKSTTSRPAYAAGDDQDEDDDYGIEVGYDVGNGLELDAGFIDETGNYVGAEYDLGNDAQLIASYADEDEEGARESTKPAPPCRSVPVLIPSGFEQDKGAVLRGRPFFVRRDRTGLCGLDKGKPGSAMTEAVSR